MIPSKFIKDWSKNAPWKRTFQIEQDLLLSRILVAIYSEEYLKSALAFRGGTALHKLYFQPAYRYSEDIDLVQINKEPIGPVMKRLGKVIDFFSLKRSTSIKGHGAKAFYKFEDEEEGLEFKIKIEMNCHEHEHLFAHAFHFFSVENGWFDGQCEIRTFQLNELLGTKLRALYQRNKGRDLFDLFIGKDHPDFDAKSIIKTFKFISNNRVRKVLR